MKGEMTFTQSIKHGFSHYTDFSGRASRSEYWYWCLFLLIAGISTTIADIAILGNAELMPINLIFNIIVAIPGLAVSIRRLHDINRSGWWLLLLFTGIGILLLLYWAIRAGDSEANRFGENPLEPSLV